MSFDWVQSRTIAILIAMNRKVMAFSIANTVGVRVSETHVKSLRTFSQLHPVSRLTPERRFMREPVSDFYKRVFDQQLPARVVKGVHPKLDHLRRQPHSWAHGCAPKTRQFLHQQPNQNIIRPPQRPLERIRRIAARQHRRERARAGIVEAVAPALARPQNIRRPARRNPVSD